MAEKSDGTEQDKIIVHVDSDLEDLIPGFLAHRQDDIRSILDALAQNDYDTIYKLSHTMKGVGGGYGFDTITEIGLKLQEAAQHKDTLEVQKRVDELSTYLERIDVVFES